MKCLSCGHGDSKVNDSRLTDDGKAIRRRRECLSCGKRFTTYETIEVSTAVVIKNNGARETFSRQKLTSSIEAAFKKGRAPKHIVNDIASRIEKFVYSCSGETQGEVSSNILGEAVLSELKRIDEAAYLRFASIFKNFKTFQDFAAEVKLLDCDNQSGEAQ